MCSRTKTPKPAITVKYMDTQMQCGSTDWGIFAIAFATALANGEQPGGLHFEQQQMMKLLLWSARCHYIPAITVKYMDTQMQCGSTDCGIFAIAFATALANGEQPGGLHFEQQQMMKLLLWSARCHYIIAARVKVSSSLHVYCSCRVPEQAGSTMIQCSTVWRHNVRLDFQSPEEELPE